MLLWMSIWISLDFYGYSCFDLLWILDPGILSHNVPPFSLCLMKSLVVLYTRHFMAFPIGHIFIVQHTEVVKNVLTPNSLQISVGQDKESSCQFLFGEEGAIVIRCLLPDAFVPSPPPLFSLVHPPPLPSRALRPSALKISRRSLSPSRQDGTFTG